MLILDDHKYWCLLAHCSCLLQARVCIVTNALQVTWRPIFHASQAKWWEWRFVLPPRDPCFSHIFETFLMVLKGFKGSGRLLNTIRIDLDTAGAGLTFPNIKNLNIHVFGNVNVLEMTFKTFHFVQGLHRTPLFFFDSSKL